MNNNILSRKRAFEYFEMYFITQTSFEKPQLLENVPRIKAYKKGKAAKNFTNASLTQAHVWQVKQSPNITIL